MQNDTVTYLNTAACGLIEPHVYNVAEEFYKNLCHEGSRASERWKMEDEGKIRDTIRGFLNAPQDTIAMVPNFSWALNGIVQSLKGDERVMLYKGDYPSVLEPFKINNFSIKWIDAEDGFTLPIDEIKLAITSKEIDLLVISHVQYNSGYKLDIDEIGRLCRDNGVWFIVDATQSMGAEPIDLVLQPIDVLISSNYKWMNAGFGTGVLYISKGFMAAYPPVVGGNNSYKIVDGMNQYIPSIFSYEPGHPNMFGLSLLKAAIEDKLSRNIALVAKHNHSLTELLLNGIKDFKTLELIGPYNMGNRCAFILLKDTNGLSAWLKDNNVIVTMRNGLVRISMHYYNTNDDIQKLINSLSMFNNQHS